MKIAKLLEKAKYYKGASGIKIPNVYDNKIPKKKKMHKLKKSVYGVDGGGAASGGGE